MRCATSRSLIALEVEGDLPRNENQQLQTHLRSCAGCRAFRKELEASQRMVHKLGFAEVDPQRYRRIREAVLKRAADPPGTGVQAPSSEDARVPVGFPRWVWVAAGLVTVAVAVGLLSRLSFRQTENPPHVVAARPTTAPAAEPQARQIFESHSAHPMPGEQQQTDRADAAEPPQDGGLQDADPAPSAQHPVEASPSVQFEPAEPIVVRLVSDDPAVVIYWLIEPETETKES